MKTRAKVGKSELIFTSPFAREAFFERNVGKDVYIVVDESPTSEMRRYFEGCLVHVTFYSHPYSGWKSFEDAREALKAEFLPVKYRNSIIGATGKVDSPKIVSVPSTADLSKKRFGDFIDAITRWLLENELCVEEEIDPENYKAWRDSAPPPGEIYPPIRRMKKAYEAVQLKNERQEKGK